MRNQQLKRFAWIFIILSVLSLIPNFTPSFGVSTDETWTGFTSKRIVPLTIKVVFVGLNSDVLETKYMMWRENLPNTQTNSILVAENNTGVFFNLTYDFVFATPAFKDQLVAYLEEIGRAGPSYNPWWSKSTYNLFFDARKVEAWFYNNSADYGGLPENGYTFIIANLTEFQSATYDQMNDPKSFPPTPHYYSVYYQDWDRDYRPAYREFGVAWGGTHRLWYLDLSAGPEFWTWATQSDVPYVPLQVALKAFDIKPDTQLGKRWLSEYIADYIGEAVKNFAIPQFVYAPSYSGRYRIVAYVFDNRTEDEKKQVTLRSTVNAEWITEAFQQLFPYSRVETVVKIKDVSEYPRLQEQILKYTYASGNSSQSPYVDLRSIYSYLQTHLNMFVPDYRRDQTEFTIPVFAFAFSGTIRFGYTYKWYVMDDPTFNKDLYGISLGDLAMIGLAHSDFLLGNNANPPQLDKGIGYTQVIIHESGHMIGLMHPHQYGSLGDYVSSAMSYYTWEYSFSQFDCDAVQRGQADQFIMEASSKLAEAKATLADRLTSFELKDKLNSAEGLLKKAEEQYLIMDYVSALQYAKTAAEKSREAVTNARNQLLAQPVFIILGILTGIIIGYRGVPYLRKRRTKSTSRRVEVDSLK
jgi:hypothetical protein